VEGEGQTTLQRLANLPLNLRRVTTSQSYVPQIDGLRLLAILPVLFWHAGLRGDRFYGDVRAPTPSELTMMSWLPHGHIGVSLFFFISGYIIAFPFLSGRAPSLKAFYQRRLYRLEPPYLAALLLCFAALALTRHTPEHAPSFAISSEPLWQSLAASAVYMHGLIFHASPKLDPPAWSLEIEVQFYLLSPLLFFAYLKLKRFRLQIGAALVVAAIVMQALLDAAYGKEGLHSFTILGHAYGFILGIVTCDYAVRAKPFDLKPRAVFDLGLIVGLIVFVVSGGFEERGLGALGQTVRDLIRAGAILLIYFGAARGVLGRKALGFPYVAVVGGMCYSIYLVHVPIMQLVSELLFSRLHPANLIQAWAISFLVLIPISLVGGLVFYGLIERPCMVPDWPAKLWARLTGSAPAPRVAPDTLDR
jgi:peptidoglycan/LPS O-acetylase OafA/YrhL